MPNDDVDFDARKFDEERGGIIHGGVSFIMFTFLLEFGGYGEGQCRISIAQKILHDGEVNRYHSLHRTIH